MDLKPPPRKIKLIANNKNGTLMVAVQPKFLQHLHVKPGDSVNKRDDSVKQEISFYFLTPKMPDSELERQSKIIQKNKNSFYVSIPAPWIKKYHLKARQIVQMTEDWSTGIITLKWEFVKNIAEMEEAEILQLEDQYKAQLIQFIKSEREKATVEKFALTVNPSACPQTKRILEMTIKDLQVFHKIIVDRETRVMSLKITEMKKDLAENTLNSLTP